MELIHWKDTLWGLLAAVLRFIPYLGPFIAALFPVALSIAVDPGWTMLFWVVGLFLVAELISNNVIEPWLYGSSTGLSSLAIIIAAIFWTMLWGPVGLFLSTPLTVCVVVIGRYVPQLEFLGTLLGSDPVLAPEEQLYQRLLAGNVEEAVEIAEDYVDEWSSSEFYDNVAIPALRLAENDRQRNTTDTNYRRLVADTAIFVAREIEDHVREKAALEESHPAAEHPSVLCLAGRTELDHAAAEMIAQVLQERGFGAKVLPPIAVTQGALGQLELHGIDAICLSYFHPQPQVFARYVFRRVRRRAPHLKLVVCCWNLMAGAEQPEELKQQMAADAVLASLQACVDQVGVWIRRAEVRGETPQVVSETEPTQAASLPMIGLAARFGRFASAGARPGLQEDRSGVRCSDRARIVCRRSLAGSSGGHDNSLDARVIAADDALVSEDVTEDARFADDPRVLEKGIRFYAGAPLRTSSGQVVGCLSLVDTQPRKLPEQDRLRLQDMANGLMVDFNSRPNDAEVQAAALRPYNAQ